MLLDSSAEGSSERSHLESSLEESGHLLLADDRRAPPTPPGESVPAEPLMHPSLEVAQALHIRTHRLTNQKTINYVHFHTPPT